MALNCGAREDSWKSLGQQGDQISQSYWGSILNIHWKGWCWSWSSTILAILCEQMTHWKSPWCILRAEEGIRGWDGWTASPMKLTWTWANSRRWWGTGRPDRLQSMGLQRGGHEWVNWTTRTTLNKSPNIKKKKLSDSDIFEHVLKTKGYNDFGWLFLNSLIKVVRERMS